MGKTRKKKSNKDKISSLKDMLNNAVETHGEEHVVQALSHSVRCTQFNSVSEIRKSIENSGQDLGHNGFGWLQNQLKKLNPKTGRNNKYAEFSKVGDEPDYSHIDCE